MSSASGGHAPPPSSPDPTPPVSVPGVTLRVASALIRICWAPPSRRHSPNCDSKGFASFQPYMCLRARSPVCESGRYIYISLKELSRCRHQATVFNSKISVIRETPCDKAAHLLYLLLTPQWASTRRLGFYLLSQLQTLQFENIYQALSQVELMRFLPGKEISFLLSVPKPLL